MLFQVPIGGNNFWKENADDTHDMSVPYLQANFPSPKPGLFKEIPIARFYSARCCEY
jgi:hypothetical protein